MRLAISELGGRGSDVLVLGPSLGTASAVLWRDAVTRLGDRFRVLAWDLPGHGGAPAGNAFTVGDLAEAIAEQVDGRFAYAGASLGGAVGLELLLTRPDRVTSAAVFSTGARISTPDAWIERAKRVRVEGVECLLPDTPARWFAPANRDGDRAKRLLANLTAVDAESYAAACEALAAFDLRDRLAEIAVPVLAVAGAHDPVTPPTTLGQIADGVQFGQLAVIDDAGHQSVAESPEAAAELVRRSVELSATPTATERVRADGMRVRREVLGDAHVDRASGGADEFTLGFQRFITTYAWGSVWTRPGLDRRSRSIVTITALVAHGHDEELALHLRAALRKGLTKEEIGEVLLQTAIYCGVPAANTAFRIAQRVFEEEASS